jgi:hypothetical protein
VRRFAAPAPAVLVALAAATGCGGGSTSHSQGAGALTSASTTTPASAAPTATAPTAATASGPAGSAPASSGADAAPAAIPTRTASGYVEFASPTRNIGCGLSEGFARCDIAERSWSPPPKPADCDLDYGQGLQVSDRGASLTCAGDTLLGATKGQVLDYDHALRDGNAVCTSLRTGVRCVDLSTGHGFVLARASYQLF